MRHRISAGAIVVRDDRVLLVRHRREGVYDFWVAPGGGVEGEESLAEAAVRETREETGLAVATGPLLAIEQLVQPDCRHAKFWFAATLLGDAAPAVGPLAEREWIVDVAWLSREALARETVFPPFLADPAWGDRDASSGPHLLPLRRMAFW